jgi:hypothetical protein
MVIKLRKIENLFSTTGILSSISHQLLVRSPNVNLRSFICFFFLVCVRKTEENEKKKKRNMIIIMRNEILNRVLKTQVFGYLHLCCKNKGGLIIRQKVFNPRRNNFMSVNC